MHKKKLNALVPMKGNSERIPNKNLKLFGDKPLYHAIIKTLQKSKYVKNIIINTDSDLISNDVKLNFENVILIDRPVHLQGDFVSMNKIIEYDIKQIEGEHFLQTHSTNPLLTSETLDKAIVYYLENLSIFDSVFSVTRWQTRMFWENGSPVNHDPTELLRTQDLPPLFEENSNFYIFSRTAFLKSGNKRIGLVPGMFEVNRLEAIDIDEPQDFQIAETLFKSKFNNH